jgi:hypothetical protein
MSDDPNQVPPRQGWLEAASRLLRVTLRSPRAKNSLGVVLRHLDPDYAPQLVETALHTDPELPHAIIGALPDGLNIVIEVFSGLVQDLTQRPTALVREALESLKPRLRVRTLGHALGQGLAKGVALLRDTESESPSLGSELVDGIVEGLHSEGIGAGDAASELIAWGAESLLAELERQVQDNPDLPDALEDLSATLGDLLKRHPQAVQRVLVPLLSPLANTVGSASEEEEPSP